MLFVGNLVDTDRCDREHAIASLCALYDIAPVYVSIDTRDDVHEKNYIIDLKEAYEETCSIVLDYAYKDIALKGQIIRLVGIYTYCLPDKYAEAQEDESKILTEFQGTPTSYL